MPIDNIPATMFASGFQYLIWLSMTLYFVEAKKELCKRPFAILVTLIGWAPILYINFFNVTWILLSFIIAVGIYMTVACLIARSPISKTFLSVVFSYFLLFVSNIPGIFFVLLTMPSKALFSSVTATFTSLASAVFLVLFFRFFPLRKAFHLLCKIPATGIYLTIISLLVLAFMCSYEKTSTKIPPALPYVLAICFVFVTAFILLHEIQSNLKDKQALHYYEQYLPILDNLIHKVRTTQHGHNNMVQSLVHLSQVNTDYEQLKSSLLQYTDTLQENILPSSFLKLENKLLAALLYYKHSQAEERGIHCVITITNPLCNSQANEFELVDAVGILIDNAIEASMDGDTIYVTIGQKNTKKEPQFHIIVENPGPVADDIFIHQIFTKGYTTKETNTANHGIGLYSLQQLTKRRHGEIIVSNNTKDEDIIYFCVELTL